MVTLSDLPFGRSSAFDLGMITKNSSHIDLIGLLGALGASSDSVIPTAAMRDCNFTVDSNSIATETITPGESEECTIINTVTINGGTVPEALEI